MLGQKSTNKPHFQFISCSDVQDMLMIGSAAGGGPHCRGLVLQINSPYGLMADFDNKEHSAMPLKSTQPLPLNGRNPLNELNEPIPPTAFPMPGIGRRGLRTARG
jgi:hypothetical protein